MTRTLTPPKGLSPEACAVWRRLNREFDLADAGAFEVLAAGLRAYDQMRLAEAGLATEGLTTLDRYGVVKLHPLFIAAKSARAQWLGALRLLGLHREGAEDDQTGAI